MDNWQEDINDFLKKFAGNNAINHISSNDLVWEYYQSKGVKMDESVNDWLIGLSQDKYPHYTTALKYVKENRKLNPLWTRIAK